MASSSVLPLSAKTLNVVPPVTGLKGVAVKSSFSAVIVGNTTIVALAVVQIVLSTSKQIVYSIVYVPEVLPAGMFIVPSELIDTPVRPSLLVIDILSSILASVAGAPLASSIPFPLSAKTLEVVPPKVPSKGVPLKSSSRAKIVGCDPQS